MSRRTIVRRAREAPHAQPAVSALTEAGVWRLSTRLGDPEWLAERRLQAWSSYQQTPMPSPNDEAWRRTDLRGLPLDRLAPKPATDVPVDPRLTQPLAFEAHGALMVLRPGMPAELMDGGASAEQGVVFLDWPSAMARHGQKVRAALGTIVPDGEGKFSALAAAFADQGVVLWVPPGVKVEAPLHSILWAPGGGRMDFSRLLVVVGDGASLTYVHEAASPTEAEGDSLHAGIVEIHVGRGAQLRFVELQNLGQHVWNFTHERARVERDGRIEWIFGAVGSRLTKNFSTLDLVGPGAEGRMSGFYFADNRQHLDHDTQQNHLAEHTTSDLLYKGALLGHSRSVWQGMIYVAPGAQKTDGYQANRNLVLSKQARADSIPGLEILADDVRCTHGATVSQLEQEPVFYLMTRGLPRPEAERVVVDGFFDPIMQRIPFEGVRERFKQMISDKMG
ncbi:MAG: Fe-S cluster assembly protein SufD [Chloroflexota bacterium]